MPSSFFTSPLSMSGLTKLTSENPENTGERVAIQRKNTNTVDNIHELAIDIYEMETQVFIVAPLSGVSASDIEIQIDNETLFISGHRENPFAEHEKNLFLSECFWGKFERKITLPASVDTRSMQATFKKGILFIEAERLAPSGVRKIHINS